MMQDSIIQENIARIRYRIEQAAARAGRAPAEISLIAVSKGVAPEVINAACSGGIKILGENRVQELLAKKPDVDPAAEWHFIGRLQLNKVRSLIGQIDLLHSLDRLELAREIDRRSQRQGIVTPVLIQVKLADEDSKQGIRPEEVRSFLEAIQPLAGIRVEGLMTIAPQLPSEPPRTLFRRLRQLSEQIGFLGLERVNMRHLSMGMSDDFEAAIEEGATLIRIGRAIFGPRGYNRRAY